MDISFKKIDSEKVPSVGAKLVRKLVYCERIPEDLPEDTMMVALILGLSFDLDVQSDSVLSWSCAFGRSFWCISEKGR